MSCFGDNIPQYHNMSFSICELRKQQQHVIASVVEQYRSLMNAATYLIILQYIEPI